MPKTRYATADFQSAARETLSQEIPVTRIRTAVTEEHVNQSHFRRFLRPGVHRLEELAER